MQSNIAREQTCSEGTRPQQTKLRSGCNRPKRLSEGCHSLSKQGAENRSPAGRPHGNWLAAFGGTWVPRPAVE